MSSTAPPWIREQILANIYALHPEKGKINIMTGRSELAPKYSIIGTDSTLVTQYMYYANVYHAVLERVDGNISGCKVEVLVHGKPVVGNVEDAMVALAGVVEEKVNKVYGIGGVKSR